MEDTLFLNTDGYFTTRIYNTIFQPGGLYVRVANYFTLYLNIEPFELENITPDTVVNHDIHIISDCDSCKTVTGIEDDITLPNEEVLLINYPNPFNLSTNFYVKIPDNFMNKSKVINIYSATGELIKNIHLKDNTTIQWDGTDSNGRVMSSGVYYYQLNVDRRSLKSGSMILLK